MANRVARHLDQRVIRMKGEAYHHRGRLVYMDPGRARSLIGQPVLELFERSSKTFGIYWRYGDRRTRRQNAAFARQVAHFLAEVIVALEGVVPKETQSEPFTNQKVRVSSSQWTRSALQARQAKERDEYSCRVCGDRPLDRYGTEGRWCLEAHHLEGLAQSRRKETVTVLERLVTVCANCHRVLSHLDPTRRGFSSLRRRFYRGARRSQ
jgi:hypothetical protein